MELTLSNLTRQDILCPCGSGLAAQVTDGHGKPKWCWRCYPDLSPSLRRDKLNMLGARMVSDGRHTKRFGKE